MGKGPMFLLLKSVQRERGSRWSLGLVDSMRMCPCNIWIPESPSADVADACWIEHHVVAQTAATSHPIRTTILEIHAQKSRGENI
ncbi:hypothetical protein GOP47_0017321 [Adiantum capillus-veneris]|uniref:Uncharacterized protein n=1 Tax=Adiantum capillus-veneris TaxID=13818 RepID=A0A9D4UF28_ADICA|nr:hypothetical protein GOP47_0017321 [Adiantum capillus-veneris]